MDPAKVAPQIVGIGASTLDHFFVVEEFPNQEGVWEASKSFAMGGGPVATALATAAHLGSSCRLFDRMGDDAAATTVIAELAACGVDTSGILRQAGARSSEASVLVRRRDGARAIAFARPTAKELTPQDLDRSCIATSEILHLNGRHPEAAMAAINWIHETGGRVSFDGGAGRYREELMPQLQQSDILIVAAAFGTAWSGHSEPDEIVSWIIHNSPAQVVAVTAGGDGSWFAERGEQPWHQPATPLTAEEIIDTTGCGDVFHGGFLHALVAGQTTSEAAQLATRIAAENACGLGGRHCLFPTTPASLFNPLPNSGRAESGCPIDTPSH